MSTLIVGYGYVGQYLAAQLKAPVHIIKRHPIQTTKSIQPLFFDLCQAHYPSLPAVDTLYYMVAAEQHTELAYRRAYVIALQKLIDALKTQKKMPKRFIFISSTAVYEQTQDTWVDETATTSSNHFSAARLLKAESLVSQLQCETMIARVSGIYGPGRTGLIQKIKTAAPQQTITISNRMSNRIHVIDLVRALDFINQLNTTVNIINLSDRQPSPSVEIANWLSQVMHRKDIQWQVTHYKHSSKSHRSRANRPISSQYLQSLGFKFQYPDYQTGFQSILAHRP